jgi:undecaprenyl-diphosphatase
MLQLLHWQLHQQGHFFNQEDMEKGFILFGAQYLYIAIALFAGIFVYAQPKELRLKLLISIAIAFPLAYIAAKIGSALFENQRPFVLSGLPPLLPHADDNGFPSDHTLLSAAFAALVFWCEKRLGTVLMFLAFLVGFSRMLAGVHHLVDVIGSMAIATGMVWVIWKYITPKIFVKYFSGRVR